MHRGRAAPWLRPAPTGPATRGPAGPAVEAAAGRQGSCSLAIGTALTAVCAACPALQPRARAPRAPLGTSTRGQPRSRMRTGHPAAMRLARPWMPAASPRPPAHARHQPDLDETEATTTPGILGVLDLRGSSAKRHVSVVHGNRGALLSHEKRA